jgi:protein ImuA
MALVTPITRPVEHPSSSQLFRPDFMGALVEISADQWADSACALGFATAWVAMRGDVPLFWTEPTSMLAEHGAPSAEGFRQYGLDPHRLTLVRASSLIDTLWAAEQALTLPGACVVCIIAPSAKPLSLTATRRLLLSAERSGSQCMLVRLDATNTSSAWTRWRIAAAPSCGSRLELGSPAFEVALERNRSGPAGQTWLLEWNAHDHTFRIRDRAMDRDMVATSARRSIETFWARAG